MKEFKIDELTVKVFDNRELMGQAAAADFQQNMQILNSKDEIRIIFASAPSQSDMLESLLKYDNIAWDKVNAFHMDEYIGLDKDSSQNFGWFIRTKLLDKAGVEKANYIDSMAEDIAEECTRYGKLVTEKNIDIVCLGIGENGHLAFNDPPYSKFNEFYPMKMVRLEDVCRQQQVNDGCFESIDLVPKHAVSLTIPTLMGGDKLICVVPGTQKARAVHDALKGPITEDCPASILRRHKNAVLYLDKDSASKL